MKPTPLLLSLLLTVMPACGGEETSTPPPVESVVNVGSSPDEPDEPEAPPPAEVHPCGDGVLDANEECDLGDENSDITPDQCRTSCLLPHCGDDVLDTAELCDDGNLHGGDGCTSTCTPESEPGEVEPNNSRYTPTLVPLSTPTAGSLYPENDKDCYSVEVQEHSWLAVSVFLPDDECPGPLSAHLLGPEGEELLGHYPLSYPVSSSCVSINPEDDGNEALQFLRAGVYTVCLEGLLQTVVPDYRIEINSEATSCDREDFNRSEAADLDVDTIPDVCDEDEDGDGALNPNDNCVRVPNSDGPITFPAPLDGFILNWLMAGPVTGTTSANQCLPSPDTLGTEDDATLTPAPGDLTDDIPWNIHISPESRVDFLIRWAGATPREGYAMAYAYSETTQQAQVAVGPDDGVRVWVNQTLVGETTACTGTSKDKFKFDVTLNAGWNPVLLKVRDQGGGWGFYFRFLTPDNAPITNLRFALDPTGSYIDNQSDSDGDGIGDLCDPPSPED